MKHCPYWNFVRQKILFIHIGNTDVHEKMCESYLFDPD